MSSLPSTPHSISFPITASSIRILLSNRNAVDRAVLYSSLSVTLLTPTDEPALAGFTKRGSPNVDDISSKEYSIGFCLYKVKEAATGISAAFNSRFVTSLSIAMAEPSISGPTKGTFIDLRTPCNVPSSPYVPCIIGNAASILAKVLLVSLLIISIFSFE